MPLQGEFKMSLLSVGFTQRYINVILQINYGANIPIILEKKDQGSGVILGRSTLGTIKSYITSIIEPDIIFVERWY